LDERIPATPLSLCSSVVHAASFLRSKFPTLNGQSLHCGEVGQSSDLFGRSGHRSVGLLRDSWKGTTRLAPAGKLAND